MAVSEAVKKDTLENKKALCLVHVPYDDGVSGVGFRVALGAYLGMRVAR